MGTKRETKAIKTKEEHKIDRFEQTKAKRIQRLSTNEQVQRLLNHYGLSLVDAMRPRFGINQQFQLATHQNGEIAERLAYATLDNLSVDLGFASDAGYERVSKLDASDMEKIGLQRKELNRLRKGALEEGKDQLNLYLDDLRPLLMARSIYLYAIPSKFIQTDVATGKFVKDNQGRILCALPTSIQAAQLYGCSMDEIKILAPQVAWLVPMLIVYRKVKDTSQLLLALDGWKTQLSFAQRKQLQTFLQKHSYCIAKKPIEQLLLL